MDDLPQSSIDGEGKGPLHEAASCRLGDHGSREFFEDGLEVGASEGSPWSRVPRNAQRKLVQGDEEHDWLIGEGNIVTGSPKREGGGP